MKSIACVIVLALGSGAVVPDRLQVSRYNCYCTNPTNTFPTTLYHGLTQMGTLQESLANMSGSCYVGGNITWLPNLQCCDSDPDATLWSTASGASSTLSPTLQTFSNCTTTSTAYFNDLLPADSNGYIVVAGIIDCNQSGVGSAHSIWVCDP